jgi:nucleotide-binding universal stress UspA family protein
MRKALLAVDGSDAAFRACLFLIDFIRQHGPVDVHVANVESKPLRCRSADAAPETLDRREAILAHVAMKPVLHALNEEGIAYQSHVKCGNVPQILVALAEQLQCDTIIMGTRGLGGIPGMAVGSVARKVLHLSRLPVICVK